MTLLCVPIFFQDLAQAQRDVALAAEAGADVVELRLDRLTQGIALPQYPVPVIVTCRPEWEGGESTLPDGERIALLEAASANARYADLELAHNRAVSFGE